MHIALWRQRQRVRVYMNEEKVWDLPRAVSASAKLNSMVFFVGGGCGNCEYYLANLRVATGAPDTRNKILTEGKWVTSRDPVRRQQRPDQSRVVRLVERDRRRAHRERRR